MVTWEKREKLNTKRKGRKKKYKYCWHWCGTFVLNKYLTAQLQLLWNRFLLASVQLCLASETGYLDDMNQSAGQFSDINDDCGSLLMLQVSQVITITDWVEYNFGSDLQCTFLRSRYFSCPCVLNGSAILSFCSMQAVQMLLPIREMLNNEKNVHNNFEAESSIVEKSSQLDPIQVSIFLYLWCAVY